MAVVRMGVMRALPLPAASEVLPDGVGLAHGSSSSLSSVACSPGSPTFLPGTSPGAYVGLLWRLEH